MRDLTDTPPVRRMTVARGRLIGDLGEADLGLAEAAALMAVKRADLWVPTSHPIAPTHVQVDAQAQEGALEVTVTVQAHARRDLDTPALCGVVAALLTLRDAMGTDARIDDVHVVQNVS